MSQRIKEENKLRRPGMYEKDYGSSFCIRQNSNRQEFHKPRGEIG